MEGHVSGNILPLFTSRAITSIWHDVLLFPEIAGAQSRGDDGGGVAGAGGASGASGAGTCTFVCTAGSDANRDANGNASQQCLFSLVTRRRKLLLDGRVVPLEIPPSYPATASSSAKTISGFPAAPTNSKTSPRTLKSPKAPTTPKARSAAFPISNSTGGSGCGGSSCPLTPTQYAPLVSWNSGVLPQTCLLASCNAANSRAASDGTASAAAGADRAISANARAESTTAAPRVDATATAPPGDRDDDSVSTPFFDYAPVDAIEIGSQVREPGDAYAVFPLLAFPVRPYRSATNAAGRSSDGGRDGDDEAPFGDADVSHKLLVIAADDPLIVGTRCNGASARTIFRKGSYAGRPGTAPAGGSVATGGLARRIAEVIQWVQQSGFTTVPGRYENGLFRGASQSISTVRFSPFSQREAQAVILHAHVAWKLLYSTLRRPANLDRTATMVRRPSRVSLPSPQPQPPANSASAANSATAANSASAANNAETQPPDENSEDENQLSASPSPASIPSFSRSGASNFASNISRRITGSLPRGAGRKGATLAASPESQPQPEPQQQQQQLARLGGSANTRSNRLNNFLDSAPAVAAAAAAAAPAAAAAAAASVASAAAASAASAAASAALSATSKLQAARAKLTARISNSQRALGSPCAADGGGAGGSGWRPRSAGSFSSDLMYLMALPAMSPASAIFTPAFDPPPPEIEGLCEAVEEEQQQLQRAIQKQERLQKQQQLRLLRIQQAERQRQQLLERGGGDVRAPVRLLILDDIDTDDEEEEEDEFNFDAETPGVRSCGSGRGGDGGAALAGTRGLEGRGSGKSGVSEPSPRSTIGPFFQSISIQSTCSPETSDVESGEGARRRNNQAKGRGLGDSGGSESGSAYSAHTSNEDGDFIDEDYNEDEDENGGAVNPRTRFARTTSVKSCPDDVTVVESWERKRTPRLRKRVGSNEDLKTAGERAGAGAGGARAPLARAAVITAKAPTVKWLHPRNDAAASDQQEGSRLGLLIGRASTTGKEAATEIAAAALRALRKGGSEGTNGGGGKAGRPPVSPRTASGNKGMWDAGFGAVPPAIDLLASAAGEVSRGNKQSGKGSDDDKCSFSGPLQARLGASSKNGTLKSSWMEERGNGKMTMELDSTEEHESDGGCSPGDSWKGGQTRLRRMAALPMAPGARSKAYTEQSSPWLSGWKGSKSANSSLKAPDSEGESSRLAKLSKKHLAFSPAEFGSATRIVLPWEVDGGVGGSNDGGCGEASRSRHVAWSADCDEGGKSGGEAMGELRRRISYAL